MTARTRAQMVEETRAKLIAAGFTAPHAPRVYTLVRLLMVIGLPILVLVLYWLGGSSPGIIKLYASLVFAAVVGLFLPAFFVRARAVRCLWVIVFGFPDGLVLMVVCVVGGVGGVVFVFVGVCVCFVWGWFCFGVVIFFY